MCKLKIYKTKDDYGKDQLNFAKDIEDWDVGLKIDLNLVKEKTYDFFCTN